jgi:hypothetical protein
MMSNIRKHVAGSTTTHRFTLLPTIIVLSSAVPCNQEDIGNQQATQQVNKEATVIRQITAP